MVTAAAAGGSWQVSVEPRLEGLATNLATSVSIGPDGTVEMASGQVGDPERVGTYPLLDTRSAIDRANAALPVPASSDDTPRLRRRRRRVRPRATLAPVPAPGPPACKVQPDGREICEAVAPGIACPQVVPPEDGAVGASEPPDCAPPTTDPDDGVDEQPLEPLARR